MSAHTNTADPERRLAAMEDVRATLEDIVAACELLGIVPTIEQRPLQPLAMGNYRSVVTVRLARGVAP